MDSLESVGLASTSRTVKNPLYKPAPKEKSLPETPKVKRLAKLQKSYCKTSNKTAPNHLEVWPVTEPLSDSERESEKDSESD